MAKITGVRCIRTRRGGTWLIMKVLTDQPGLYGIGSVSDIMHYDTVQKAVEEGIAPLVIGEEVGQIENLWQRLYTRGYWRNGSVLMTALAGLDMALWDIMGKEAGMPVYRLLGGPCRPAVACYAHAGGDTLGALEEDVRRYMEEGYRHIRCQLGPYGGGGFIPIDKAGAPKNAWPMPRAFDDEAYLENIPKMFEYLRDKLGFGPKLTHDVHEHLQPHNAVTLAKLLEPYRLFFLEDNLPPEQIAWYRLIRQQCTTPQAIGELFTSPHEWQPLIAERLIDYIRVRVSKAGGITPCRKIGAPVRGLRGADRLPGGRRQRPGEPGRRDAPGHGPLVLRHPGGEPLPPGGTGGLSRPRGARRWLPLPEQQPRPGHRHR